MTATTPKPYTGSAILVTAIEWLTGFILEKVFHNKWWDYSNMPLNLNGYVCLLFSLIWGVFCVFIVDVFHPLIDTLLSHIPFLVENEPGQPFDCSNKNSTSEI